MPSIISKIRQKKSLSQFIKFGIVGVSGTLVDLGFYNLLALYFGYNIYLSRTFSFIFAAINNYIWNRVWTFRSQSKKITQEFIKFFIVSAIGLLLNLAIMKLLQPFSEKLQTDFLQKNVPVLIAIVIVFIWNFIINKIWTFKKLK